MTEASGRYSLGKMYGFKLHGVINSLGMLGRFAIVPANEHDATVAKALFNEQDDKLRVLGDKGYVGTGIYAQLRDNAKNPYPWSAWLGRARKLIETTFSSLIRGKNMALGQLNSFWSIRAKVCRKIAAHNLAIVFLAMYP
jgi:IS5 family transposase